MTTTLSDPEEPDEPFDPSDYPEEFTAEIFRDMPLSDLELVERHTDELSERQRNSFRAARDEVMEPILEKFRTTFIPPKMRSSWTVLSPETARSIQQTSERIREHFKVSEQLATGNPERITGSLDARLPAATASVTGRYTPGELERDIDHDAAILAVQKDMLELMRKQHLSTTRGAFFAVIVSVSVIVAGVAPIVAASDSDERWAIILISAAVAALGLLAYISVRVWQARHDTPRATPES